MAGKMKQEVIDFLDNLGVQYTLVNHPAMFTVADAAKLSNEMKPIKNLLLQEDGGDKKFLIVMDGAAKLDLKLLRDKLGSKRLRFANSDTLNNIFGVTPGSVSIFGFLHPNSKGVKVVIDNKLFGEKELSFHPNENTSTVIFSTDSFIPILDDLGCDYQFLTLY
jgi:Ala-tRNA(Pro) deacylase